MVNYAITEYKASSTTITILFFGKARDNSFFFS